MRKFIKFFGVTALLISLVPALVNAQGRDRDRRDSDRNRESRRFEDTLISEPVDALLTANSLPLRVSKELNLRGDERINNLIIIASDASGRGDLTIMLDNQILSTQALSQRLRVIEVEVPERRDLRSEIILRARGRVLVAWVGVTVRGSRYNNDQRPLR